MIEAMLISLGIEVAILLYIGWVQVHNDNTWRLRERIKKEEANEAKR